MAEKMDMIPKKRAALEIYKENRKVFNLGLITIAGVFVSVIAAVYSTFAGALTASIFSSVAIYFVFAGRQKMNYLNTEYNLGFKR